MSTKQSKLSSKKNKGNEITSFQTKPIQQTVQASSVTPSQLASQNQSTSNVTVQGLNHFTLQTGIIPQANNSPIIGSSYIEYNSSKVFVYVYMPRPAPSQKHLDFSEGTIDCEISLAAHLKSSFDNNNGHIFNAGNNKSGIYQKFGQASQNEGLFRVCSSIDQYSPASTSDSSDSSSSTLSRLSTAVISALSPVVRLANYPKTVVPITVLIVQSSIFDLPAILNASSAALIDAKIEMRDILTSYGLFYSHSIEKKQSSDAMEVEGITAATNEKVQSRTMVTIAAMAALSEVTYLDFNGSLSPQLAVQCITNMKEQCNALRTEISSQLVEKYGD
jgi:ribonuclease PH